ncbi:MAG TPA: hypothetical protein VL547_05955 [Dinghuibacter sp.]|uniref:hypothetical protein n=1 Tax=Dinghuibacter sp. TaxID=2024697 RepID=UPI002BAB78B4|nr:hypothetical protein [Dinghuibacter sp.]HTJ11544.1 hypothetical protein [Dinghuibacter sp.]
MKYLRWMWLPLVLLALTWVARMPPQRYSVKRIAMPDYYGKSFHGFTRQSLDQHPRDYLPLRLTGKPDTDNVLLAYARIRVAEIRNAHDTLHGVKFLWSDSVTYGTVMTALDVPGIGEIKTYMLYADSLWILNTDYVVDSARLVVPRPID